MIIICTCVHVSNSKYDYKQNRIVINHRNGAEKGPATATRLKEYLFAWYESWNYFTLFRAFQGNVERRWSDGEDHQAVVVSLDFPNDRISLLRVKL